MSQSRSDKLLGPYTDFALLVLGFILTTVVGGFLTYRYQERARADAERTARLQAELVRATTVSEEVSRMLDRRLYRITSP
jgi:hypothetical protein